MTPIIIEVHLFKIKYFRSIKLAENLKTQRIQRGNINENYSNVALDYQRGIRL